VTASRLSITRLQLCFEAWIKVWTRFMNGIRIGSLRYRSLSRNFDDEDDNNDPIGRWCCTDDWYHEQHDRIPACSGQRRRRKRRNDTGEPPKQVVLAVAHAAGSRGRLEAFCGAPVLARRRRGRVPVDGR
jgi:hypothetical protein